VVITRAKAQSATLHAALVAHGAVVVEVAVLAIAAPRDGGVALRDAVAHVERYDWIVLTSPNGVDAFAGARDQLAVDAFADARDGLADRATIDVPIAVVGSGTAARLELHGLHAALLPERFVAEGLVDAFPARAGAATSGTGRVLVAQAEAARPIVVDGLRTKGWTVDAVVAYRSVAAPVEPAAIERARTADAIAFTSASTVERFLDTAGRGAVPPVVASIGPITTAAARRLGIDVTVEAEPHTVDGLVAALAAHFAS
jgi:uroporphyrinogen-III synthase